MLALSNSMEILAAILGLVFGSFSGVLYDRENLGLRGILGRSRCSTCKHKLSWFELIPLFSYLLLQGKCRWCKSKIEISAVAVEVFTSTLFFLIFLRYGASVSVLGFYVMAVLAYPFVYIDLRTLRLPNAWVLLSLGALVYQAGFELVRNGISESIDRGMIAFALVSFFYLILHLLTGGKGIGMGDVKLAPILVTSAALIDFDRGFVAFMSGILVSGIFAIVLLLIGKASGKTKVAFGPFLILGYWLALLLPDEIVTQFVGLWLL